MKRYHWKKCVGFTALAILIVGLLSCSTQQAAAPQEDAAPQKAAAPQKTAAPAPQAAAPQATLTVTPAKTVLSPALIKNPIQIAASGFTAKEMVVVELVLPPGVTVKTVPEGENVGLAYATADETGNIATKIGPAAVLNWFFQVDWTPNMKPVFAKAKPLKPGIYGIVAEGMDSGVVVKGSLEFVPPPKKKQ
ncbi:MAG: hypothetical protein GY866_00055 [Proteobacteria bacterium]|nr:hypothetical protein [Pseudomonadota bacterium]